MRSPLSQYGFTRYRAGYRVQTIAVAVAVAGAGAAIGIARLRGPVGLVVALYALFAGTRALISWRNCWVGAESTSARPAPSRPLLR